MQQVRHWRILGTATDPFGELCDCPLGADHDDQKDDDDPIQSDHEHVYRCQDCGEIRA